MKTLTLKELQKIKTSFDEIKIGRIPKFRFHPFVSEIYHGLMIDHIFELVDPSFDRKVHQGFIVPSKYESTIKKAATSTSLPNPLLK